MSLVRRMQDGPYRLPSALLLQVVELLDSYGHPFILTSPKTASRLGLLRRAVLVCLKNTAGKVYLHKRPSNASLYAGLWDISVVGTVFAGESPVDAAERELDSKLGIRRTRLRAVGQLPYTDGRGTSLSATFFLAGPSSVTPRPSAEFMEDGMFVDEHELEGLAFHQQDMLTPELVWAVQSGWIFRKPAGPFLTD